MNGKIEEEITVHVDFCDGSSVDHVFLPTAWGNLAARDDYQKYVDMGLENNRVWSSFPHVHKVLLNTKDDTSCVPEVFECSCGKKAAHAG